MFENNSWSIWRHFQIIESGASILMPHIVQNMIQNPQYSDRHVSEGDNKFYLMA